MGALKNRRKNSCAEPGAIWNHPHGMQGFPGHPHFFGRLSLELLDFFAVRDLAGQPLPKAPSV